MNASAHHPSDFWSEVAVTVLVGGLALYVGIRNLWEKKPPVVSSVLIYPIKSGAEMPLKQAKVTAQGFEYDRILQVTDTTTKQYCTPRDAKYAKLFHITPTFLDKSLETLVLTAPDHLSQKTCEIQLNKSKKGTTTTTTTTTTTKLCTPMTGPPVMLDEYGQEVSQWLCQAVNVPAGSIGLTGIGKKYKRFVQVNPDQDEALPSPSTRDDTATTATTTSNTSSKHPVSLADEAPYLLTSMASLRELNRRLQQRGKPPVDMRRFRPNLVLGGDSVDLEPFIEDTWARIRIGPTAEFIVWQRCGRCTMTTIDRDSLQRGPEPLATLSTFRERAHGQRNFGMHLIPVTGTGGSTPNIIIKVGDKVQVLEYNAERLAEWKKLFGKTTNNKDGSDDTDDDNDDTNQTNDE